MRLTSTDTAEMRRLSREAANLKVANTMNFLSMLLREGLVALSIRQCRPADYISCKYNHELNNKIKKLDKRHILQLLPRRGSAVERRGELDVDTTASMASALTLCIGIIQRLTLNKIHDRLRVFKGSRHRVKPRGKDEQGRGHGERREDNNVTGIDLAPKRIAHTSV